MRGKQQCMRRNPVDAAADAGSDSGAEGEAFLTNRSGAKDRDSSTAQADTADGSEGNVLSGNTGWSVEFTMWPLIVCLPQLFLSAFCLPSLWQRQAGKRRSCAAFVAGVDCGATKLKSQVAAQHSNSLCHAVTLITSEQSEDTALW
ncbi:hypothetical protein TRVL_09649 [Trypanosoma vivax]|nr:hypothetical protein TRVL_09649 [Trypanosoma vivax]